MGAGHLLSNSKVLLYHRHVKMAHGEVVLDCVYTQATSTPQVQHNPSFLWNQHNNLSFWVHRSANWGSKTSSIWCDCTLWCRPVSDTPSTEHRHHGATTKMLRRLCWPRSNHRSIVATAFLLHYWRVIFSFHYQLWDSVAMKYTEQLQNLSRENWKGVTCRLALFKHFDFRHCLMVSCWTLNWHLSYILSNSKNKSLQNDHEVKQQGHDN